MKLFSIDKLLSLIFVFSNTDYIPSRNKALRLHSQQEIFEGAQQILHFSFQGNELFKHQRWISLKNQWTLQISLGKVNNLWFSIVTWKNKEILFVCYLLGLVSL
jgi:hypothetical protein